MTVPHFGKIGKPRGEGKCVKRADRRIYGMEYTQIVTERIV